MEIGRTARLSLHEVTASDTDFILAILNDPDFIRYIADRNIRTQDQAAQYIEEKFTQVYAQDGYGMYKVCLLEDGRALGMCGLVNRPALPGTDIGFAFLPEGRGKGYAFESAHFILERAFEHHGLPEILAITAEDNQASRSLCEKLGLKFEGMWDWSEEEQVCLYKKAAPAA
ncbi:MAG: GNAT family N-acetyltransferase [Bacteroidota bacterium]